MGGGSGWFAGVAERDVTPPLGTAMTGYDERPGPATEVLDPLLVRALALGTNRRDAVVLVSSDLLALDRALVAEVRDELREDVAPERLLLSQSHTHSGPATIDLAGMGRPDPRYCRDVVDAIASAVREALSSLRPAGVCAARTEAAIGVNRRLATSGGVVLASNPEGPYDRTVAVLALASSEGSPSACWFSHGVHPTTLPGSSTAITAEWPGAACRAISERLGCAALFAQAAAGDVEPRERGSVEATSRLGGEVAEAVVAAWDEALPVGPPPARALLERVVLPTESGSELELELHALRVGSFGIVGMCAEPFARLGTAIASASPFRVTAVLGYTNGCVGYLGDEQAYAGPPGSRGYEIDVAPRHYRQGPFDAGAPRRVVAAATDLLRRVRA